MSSYTYNRYLWLFNTLLQYKKLTFQELQEKWDASAVSDGTPLSLRTFHAHRKAVEDMFQVLIDCDPAAGYAYYIVEDSMIENDRARRWLLNSFNVSNMVSEARDMRDRILLEDIPVGTEYLPVIIHAMQAGRVLTTSYQPFYEKEPLEFHISPYCLRVLRQRWYVLGWVKEREGLRHLALDRILRMEEGDEHYSIPPDFSAERYYRDSVGIWVVPEGKVEKVLLRAYGQQAEYLRTLPLHHSQRVAAKTDDYTDFEYRLCCTPDLVGDILAMGEAVEVLAPKRLREDMKEVAQRLAERYR